MSIPPSIIRVKRKRVEESPVTFLHVDPGSKRHRSGSTWAYQRRDSVIQPPPASASESPPGRPVIHVSGPDVAAAATKRPSPPSRVLHSAPSSPPSPIGAAGRQSLSPQPEPRQFRIALVNRPPTNRLVSAAGISKRDRYGPALFVERARKQRDAKAQSSAPDAGLSPPPGAETRQSAQAPVRVETERQLKRPGTVKKSAGGINGAPPSTPLPASLTLRPGENLDEIAADMDRWVLNEIRESLGGMGQDQQPPGNGPRFKPKSPAQRYHQRHPDGPDAASQVNESADVAMTDVDQDGDAHDWVIEEYVRIPASAVAQDVSPSDVGLLVLDDDEESNFFFGPSDDDDDEDDDNDDDENAENHYTADYPEDEADSNDDEYNLLVGGYGNGDASDNDDSDYVDYDGQEDCPPIQGNGNGDDDDARMARIRNFLKHSSAFG